MKPKPGTYQTTFRVEKWEKKRKTPRVQYRTTFGGPVIDHNNILDLVRELHASEDGKAGALVDVFKRAEAFDIIKEILHDEILELDIFEEWFKKADARFPYGLFHNLTLDARRTSDETGDKK